MHWPGIKPSWARKDFVKDLFYLWFTPTIPWPLKPGIWSIREIAHVWQVEGQQRTLWLKHRFPAARMTWALRDSEGYLTDSASHCTVLLIEAIFSSTANSRLPFTLVSLILKKLWHWCNDADKTTHPWNEAKPKWRRVSSGRPGCRTSYNFPSPTSSRRCSAICTPYFARAINLYLMAISCSPCQQIQLSAVEEALHFFVSFLNTVPIPFISPSCTCRVGVVP